MSKAIAQLTESLNKLNEKLETLKAAKKMAEDRIRDERMYIENCEHDIHEVEVLVAEKSNLITAMREDLEAHKVAAEGYLQSLDTEEGRLNFILFCETLGIELEIDADENSSEDEAREEISEIVQTGT